MYILNVEDNVFKHNNIEKVVSQCGQVEMEWEKNLVDAVERICDQIDDNRPFDLIITDMWYPEYRGGKDSDSGEKLIKKSQEKGWNIPIILCSSVNYTFPGIIGSIHYSEEDDEWKDKLLALIEKIKE